MHTRAKGEDSIFNLCLGLQRMKIDLYFKPARMGRKVRNYVQKKKRKRQINRKREGGKKYKGRENKKGKEKGRLET